MSVAPRVRHEWTERQGEPGTFDCPACKCWTANLPLYKTEVCDAKNRRKNKTDRREQIVKGEVELLAMTLERIA